MACQDDRDQAPDDLETGETAAPEQKAAGTQEIEPGARQAPTEVRPALDAGETARQPASRRRTHLRDVSSVVGSYVSERAGALARLADGRRGLLVALGLVAAAALVALAVLVAGAAADATDRPSDEAIAQDAALRVEAPAYEAGSYGSSDILVFRGADVTSCERVDAIEGAPTEGVEAYARATVLATFSGSSVRAEVEATLGFARVSGSWAPAGSEETGKVAWHATAGVDPSKVVTGMGAVLDRAEAALGDGDDLPSLADLYAAGSFEVKESSFDEGAQTDVVVISCTRVDGFAAYSCEVTATFSFAPAGGRWELVGAEASEGAKTPSLESALGTWRGTFQSQSTEGTRCLAAREAGLEVVVTGYSGEGDGLRLEGSVSGVAHYHAHPSGDAARCDGDLAFEGVPFVARLVSDEGGLTFSAALPQDVDGSLVLTLRFGVEGDPGAVSATLETTYEHTRMILFVPVEETLVYEDEFLLERA